MSVEQLLDAGSASLDIFLSAKQRQQCLDYLALLARWNQRVNLTAIREPSDMVTRHLLDSLAILPFIDQQKIADVGSGAGLPGVPLAIMRPELEFHLVDSNRKKTTFLQQVKTSLGLSNITVHHARAEHLHSLPTMDAVVTRAFSSLADMISVCEHLLSPDGRLLAMKGRIEADELAAAEALASTVECIQLQVPGLDEQRHLVRITPHQRAANHSESCSD